MKKDLKYYLSLPYSTELTPTAEEEGGGFVACIPILGRWSAVGDGETPDEAYKNLHAALPSLIQGWLDKGICIPEPRVEGNESLPNGKVALRMSRSLHARVLEAAGGEGISVNAYIVSALEQVTSVSSMIRVMEAIALGRFGNQADTIIQNPDAQNSYSYKNGHYAGNTDKRFDAEFRQHGEPTLVMTTVKARPDKDRETRSNKKKAA